MKAYVADLVSTSPTAAGAVNQVREYLQARILDGLQRAGAMICLAFHGGTALRFLYSTPRYSEDLDFALERDPTRYDLTRYVGEVERPLLAEGYVVDTTIDRARTVESASVRFPGLLHELGLSPHPNQVLWVKIEVDTNPPAGAGLAATVVRRHVTLHLQHHDRPSLLAGKLHAILQRRYTKGRDVFDLFWYLSDPTWPEPNLTLLNNALSQTGWTGERLTEKNWRELVANRLREVAWDRVADDVSPFLEPTADPSLLTFENVMQVLMRPRGSAGDRYGTGRR
jgi:hypothetical protein